jgi:exodeoxyribonuclease V alpha subunit
MDSSAAGSTRDGAIVATEPNVEVVVRGEIARVIFSRDDFVIARLAPGDEVVAGSLPALRFGEEYEFTGRWTANKYGEQFRFSRFSRRLPTTINAVSGYLQNSCPWIGPAVAAALIDTYGVDAIVALKDRPEEVAARINGITPARAREIQAVLREGEEDEALDIALRDMFEGQRIPAKTVSRIKKEWGHGAPERIRENAYLLIQFRGVGFKTADAIALRVGYARDGVFRVRAGIIYALEDAASNGHVCLPRDELIGKAANLLDLPEGRVVGEVDGMTSERAAVVQSAGYVYSRALFDAEDTVARRIKLLMAAPCEEVCVSTGDLYPDQINALQHLSRSPVSLLTGAPGTGKTFTLRAVIDAFAAAGLEIAIAAPTGKAARRVTELTGHPATTIHRLLEPKVDESDGYVSFHFSRNEDNPLQVDVVIIDEVSMLDVSLAASLLKAIPQRTRLILVGDIYQLPSVGPGAVLKSLIECGTIPHAELTTIKRQDPGLIVTNCHRIKDGRDIEEARIGNGDADMYFLRREEEEAVRNTILDLYFDRLAARPECGNKFRDIQIICPRREATSLSAKEFNKAIQARIHTHGERRRIMDGDKVIQLKNGYFKDKDGVEVFVANGDIGFVEAIESGKIRVRFDLPDRVVEFEAGNNDLDLAYALTIHKYQGSEAPIIIMPIHRSAGPLVQQRNLLYTAVSRAAKLCVLVGQRGEVKKIVDRNKQLARHNLLAKRLRDEVRE